MSPIPKAARVLIPLVVSDSTVFRALTDGEKDWSEVWEGPSVGWKPSREPTWRLLHAQLATPADLEKFGVPADEN
ncbi:MAG TPA: hypothetical protein VNN62_14990 [Methylomirabilota bacterium]|nr:hypothetical protein [Methylomirabilota bacterium]